MKNVWFSLFIFIFSVSVANANDFAFSDAWLKLMHYQKKSDKYVGLVESEEFYLGENGRFNPEIELKANIEAFKKGKFKCEFPARFNLLKKEGLVDGNLSNCLDYNNFIKDVKPDGITVLFTNAYMSNPASLFGHTLIRIDTKRKGTQMLAHGSNFGADSGIETGFTFAFKGLFGGYLGVYSVNPYWDIINTYNNIENRDIWEYNLNLSDEEKEKFVNHLYEMRKAKIRYYFLSKNCSYMILELLEAVKPELELTDNYDFWVIPLDTLKTIKKIDGLIKSVNYRPARYTKLKKQIDDLNTSQYKYFLKGIKKHNYNMHLSEQEKAEVLEAQYQYYQYRYTANDMDLSEYRKNSFIVLRERSKLPDIKDKIYNKEDPSLSHDSFQVAIGTGVYDGKNFEQLEIRPAYTNLADNTYGLIKGAEISVLSSKWRYYNENEKFVLEEFSPIKIKSLVIANRIFNPISYATNWEIKREYNPQTMKEGYVAGLNMGVGQTYELWGNFWLYGLIKIGGQYGGFIPDNYWIGFIPEVGLYKDLGFVRFHSIIEKIWANRKFGDRLKYKTIVSWGFNNNLSLELEFNSSHNAKGNNQQEFLGSIRYYM